jgi:phosphate transport system permease protein
MCVYTASVFSVGVLVAIVVYICIKGIPHLSLSLFSFEYNSTNVSLFPALVNTILMTALSLLIAVPVGVFSAVYLAEYARRGNRAVKVIRMTAETLSGIPSIVYGLFGYLMFVIYFGWVYSILAVLSRLRS